MRTESEAIPRGALMSVRQAEARRREAIARRDAALRELAEAELLVSESQRLQAEAARSRAQVVQKRTDAARRHADTAQSADDHGTRRVAPAALAAPRHGSARARAQQAERDAYEAESARDRAVAAPSRPSLCSEPDFSAAQRVWACDSDAATTDGASSSGREGPESEPTSLRLTLDINISGGAATALVNSSQKQCRCGGMRTHATMNAEQSGRRAGTSVPIPIETWGAAENLQSNEDSGAEVDLEDLAHDLDTLEISDDGSRTPGNSDAAEGSDTEDEESSSDSEDDSNADSEDESNADPEDDSNASDDAPVAEAPEKRQKTHHSNRVRQPPSRVRRCTSHENVSSAQPRKSERQSREPATQLSKRDADVRDDENDRMLRASIENAVMGEPPCVSWDDIAGLDGAKEALREAVILPAKFPNLFTGNLKPVSAILLYGPPGTGKTYLAKAVATESRSTFFSISTSDLVGHWHGESERLVRHLFSAAREAKPSIIFIDEIDALCGGRDASNSDTSRRMLTELLAQMNGVGKDQEGVLVLGATNTPWDLDPAVRRRFERRIFIPLPDAASRARMFKLNTDKMHTTLTSKDYKRLAEMTRGYSGADVAVAVKDALMQPIRKLQRATHFKKVAVPGCERRKLTPCGPRDKGAREMNWMDIREDKLLQPPPELEDFIRSVRNTRPTVNKKDLARQVKFTNEFGQDGV